MATPQKAPTKVSPLKKADTPKRPGSLVYFRKIKEIDPAHKIGGIRPPTYLKTEDSILWPYEIDDEGNSKPVGLHVTPEMLVKMQTTKQIEWLPRSIRYIQGLQTFFKDEQERGGKELSPQVLGNYANRDALVMTDGEIRVQAFDMVRINFLHCMNQCENQHPLANRYSSAPPLYRLLDFGARDRQNAERGKLKEKAFKLAQDARNSEMIPHAKYLNIPFIIGETTEERDIDSIKSDYKDYAYNKPEHFIATFNDPRLKINYLIQSLLERREILVENGQARFNTTNTPIMTIPPDKTPSDALTDYSLTEDGEYFAQQIQAFKLLETDD